MVVVDAPPVLTHSDARWLARIADGVVVIHNPRQVSAAVLAKAIARLRGDCAPVLRTVLSRWEDPVLAAPAPGGRRKRIHLLQSPA